MTQLSNSARASAFVRHALSYVAEAEGRGSDDYWPEPVIHPMAEAKLIATTAALRRTKILSVAAADRTCTAAAARLQDTALSVFGGLAWGLNFPWEARRASREEPYLVTTALVVAALSEARRGGWSGGEALLGEGTKALENWPKQDAIPIYSPTLPYPILNSAALWAAALVDLGVRDAEDAEIRPVRGLVRDLLVPSVGWRYAADSNVVDLLHGAYILRACRAFEAAGFVEAGTLVLLSSFRTDAGLADRLTVEPLDKIYDQPAKASYRIAADALVLRGARAARPWSLGEVLALVADVAETSAHAGYWNSVLRHLLSETVDLYATAAGEIAPALLHQGQPRLRHLTHLTHGVARALEVLRRQSAAPGAARQPADQPLTG